MTKHNGGKHAIPVVARLGEIALSRLVEWAIHISYLVHIFTTVGRKIVGCSGMNKLVLRFFRAKVTMSVMDLHRSEMMARDTTLVVR
jgi:hypothetical protein